MLTHVNTFAFYDGLSRILATDYKAGNSARNAIPLEHASDNLRDGDRAKWRSRRRFPQCGVSRSQREGQIPVENLDQQEV